MFRHRRMLGIREHDEHNLHQLQRGNLLLQLLCMERGGTINIWNIIVGSRGQLWQVEGVIPPSSLLCGDWFSGVRGCCCFIEGTGKPSLFTWIFSLYNLTYYSPLVHFRGKRATISICNGDGRASTAEIVIFLLLRRVAFNSRG